MDFSEKLLTLRKANNLTEEQLAQNGKADRRRLSWKK